MLVIAISALGLLIGPMLAAVASSVPDRSGGGHPFLTCATCGAPESLRTIAPILAYRESCDVCGRRPPRSALVVSVVTAAAFGVVAAAVGRRWELLPILVFVAALIALSTVDVVRYRLPDKLLFPSLAVSGTLLMVVSLVDGTAEHLVPALVAAAAYFLLLLLPNLVAPTGLAFGDVKLAAMLGLFVGWMRDSIAESFVLVIYALLLGMGLGIVSGLLVGIGRRVIGPDFLADPDFPVEPGETQPLTKTAFPFGPALALSAVVIMLSSETLLGTPGLLS